MLQFNDGMIFDLSGELRLEHRKDGPYVVGRGMLNPVSSSQEGRELIHRLKGENGE